MHIFSIGVSLVTANMAWWNHPMQIPTISVIWYMKVVQDVILMWGMVLKIWFKCRVSFACLWSFLVEMSYAWRFGQCLKPKYVSSMPLKSNMRDTQSMNCNFLNTHLGFKFEKFKPLFAIILVLNNSVYISNSPVSQWSFSMACSGPGFWGWLALAGSQLFVPANVALRSNTYFHYTKYVD